MGRLTNPSSRCAPAVSSTLPLAEPSSTTPSLLLDTDPRGARSTTSLETPGPLPGETKDTSRSPPSQAPVSAVSSSMLSTQRPTDHHLRCKFSFEIKSNLIQKL